MGTYFNPNNGSFKKDKNSIIYVDKTGLLEFLNTQLGTNSCCISLSHARRFGKSHAAGMIDAYYSLGSESSGLFDGTEISTKADYKKHMNKYNVIHIDVSTFWDSYKDNIVEKITEYVIDELKKEFGDKIDCEKMISAILMDVFKDTGIPFIIIIDEWDCIIRNSKDQSLVHKYLQFLHTLFKSEESKSFLALAYITGILPIKKIKDESALNNFREYTMLSSYPITEYFGFNEKEVEALCQKYDMDFETTRAWYNGYLIDGKHMYNPNSVTEALQRHMFDSYWRNTSSYETINTFITLNYDGLKNDVLNMLAGGKVRINTNSFKNDINLINSKDDAITALIHLGYLGYDADRKAAFVPNYEVAYAFDSALAAGALKDYKGNLLLVGISYDKDSKEHECVIEKI